MPLEQNSMTRQLVWAFEAAEAAQKTGRLEASMYMCMTNACPTWKQQQHSLPCIGTRNAIHPARQKAHLKACKLEFAILEASPQELLPPRQVHALSDCFHGVRGGVVIIVCVSTCSIGNLQSSLHSTAQDR